MDGCRARRMKIGSPLGRIIDEAGDYIVMSNYSTMMAMMFVFDNQYLELFAFMLLVCAFADEIKYKVCNVLSYSVGEFSIVELQLFISIVFWTTSYFGSETLQRSV